MGKITFGCGLQLIYKITEIVGDGRGGRGKGTENKQKNVNQQLQVEYIMYPNLHSEL